MIILLTFSFGFSFLLIKDLYNSTKEHMEVAIAETFITINQETKKRILSPDELARLVYEMMRFDPYTEVVLLDKEGNVLHHEALISNNKFLNEQFIRRTDFMRKTQELGEISMLGDEKMVYLIYGEPLAVDSLPDVAYIGFSKSLIFIYSIVESTIKIIKWVVVSLVVVMVVFALILSRMIAGPIKELQQYATAIGEGNVYLFKPNKVAEEIYSLGVNMMKMERKLDLAREKEKDYFSRASHELKTPLAIIHGFGEALTNGLVSDSQSVGRVILKQSNRLNHIVEQVLLLSKMDSEIFKYEMGPINLGNFLENMVEIFSGVLGEELIIQVACPEEVIILGNEELLHQAIDNPLSNSLRYAQNTIKVSVKRRLGFAVLKISDDGGGLEEESLAKVFDRFYKGENGKFGLGMSIMKSAVENMGGNVQLYNGAQGLVVLLEIPLA